MNKDPQSSPLNEETSNNYIVAELAVALEEQEMFVLSDNVDYASIVEGVLQVTSDIEEKIAASDRGETVSMDEFKTMFARLLD